MMRVTERRTKILLELRCRDASDFSRGLAEIRHAENEQGKKIWRMRNGKWRIAPSKTKRYWWE